MSVQIRRRREAAVFLQTYVGAQGELLVDTTNNRVQVHDGATPGGFAAAASRDLAGRNAGINTNFGVNQRAYASGTALAAGAYGHDRHKAGAGGCTYTFTQAVPDTAVTITAGTLIQAVDVGNVYATSWWLTWAGTATARVWQGSSPSGSFSSGVPLTIDGVTVNALMVTGLTIGMVANVEFSTGTLGTARPWQFEAALPNAGPTRFERRHAELALCQRYFQRWSQPPLRGLIDGSSPVKASRFAMVIPTMRASPAVSINGSLLIYNGVSGTAGSAIVGSYGNATAVEIDITLSSTSGYSAGQLGIVYQGGSGSLDLNAEI